MQKIMLEDMNSINNMISGEGILYSVATWKIKSGKKWNSKCLQSKMKYWNYKSLSCSVLPLSNVRLLLKQSKILSLRKVMALMIKFLMNLLNLPILLNASVSLLVPSSSLFAPDKFEAPKLERSKARKRFKTLINQMFVFFPWVADLR